VPASQVPDAQAPGRQVPASQVPDAQAPGWQVPASQVPDAQDPAAQEAAGAESRVAALDASVAELDQLDDLPVTDHVARYDALHNTLSEALAAIDGV
jgi:hypothetical protein